MNERSGRDKRMKTYVFTLSSERVLVIRAKDIHAAMKEVEENWYSAAFEDSFTVKMVTGSNI